MFLGLVQLQLYRFSHYLLLHDRFNFSFHCMLDLFFCDMLNRRFHDYLLLLRKDRFVVRTEQSLRFADTMLQIVFIRTLNGENHRGRFDLNDGYGFSWQFVGKFQLSFQFGRVALREVLLGLPHIDTLGSGFKYDRLAIDFQLSPQFTGAIHRKTFLRGNNFNFLLHPQQLVVHLEFPLQFDGLPHDDRLFIPRNVNLFHNSSLYPVRLQISPQFGGVHHQHVFFEVSDADQFGDFGLFEVGGEAALAAFGFLQLVRVHVFDELLYFDLLWGWFVEVGLEAAFQFGFLHVGGGLLVLGDGDDFKVVVDGVLGEGLGLWGGVGGGLVLVEVTGEGRS